MNSNIIHKCPICEENTTINDEFCPKCSWEIIDIPKDSSPFLLNYFSKKVDKHKKMFRKSVQDSDKIKKLNNKNSLLEEELAKTREEIKKSENDIKKLNQKLENKKQIEEQLKIYIERYGESFEHSTNSSKKSITIYWKIINNSIHISYNDEVSNLRNKVVVLFRKERNPQIGNFDFSVIGVVENNIINVNINNFPKGSYLVKPISLSNRMENIYFMNENKSLNSSDYNKDNLIINIL